MSLNNIHLIGTSHIAQESIQLIKTTFLHVQPTIVAVELDSARLQLLFSPQHKSKISFQTIKQLGFGGFLFVLIGSYVQKKLGKSIGMTPGADMKYAVELARRNSLQVSLIDRSLEKTVKRLMKQLTWKEKMRIAGDICMAPFARFFKKQKKLSKELQISLTSVPQDEVLITLLSLVKERYPTFYRVLIDERNHIMAKKLVVLAKKNPLNSIIAVIGAGHKKGMQELISYYDKKIESISF